MTLEEQLQVIPETEMIYLLYDKKEFMGYKHHIFEYKLCLDRKVKRVDVCWFDDDEAYLCIEVEE